MFSFTDRTNEAIKVAHKQNLQETIDYIKLYKQLPNGLTKDGIGYPNIDCYVQENGTVKVGKLAKACDASDAITDEVKAAIIANPDLWRPLLLNLVKNPTRQNFYEKAQIAEVRNILVSYPEFTGDKPWVKTGFDPLGNIVFSTNRVNSPIGMASGSKDFDFLIVNGSINVYFNMKYCTASGGNQDNQKNDAGVFMQLATLNSDHHFVALIDGNNRSAYISNLTEYTRPNVHVTDMAGLPRILQTIKEASLEHGENIASMLTHAV